jgi:hypothetical protein
MVMDISRIREVWGLHKELILQCAISGLAIGLILGILIRSYV